MDMQNVKMDTLQFFLGGSLFAHDGVLCLQTHTVYQHVHITGDHAVALGYVMKYPHGAQLFQKTNMRKPISLLPLMCWSYCRIAS